MRIIVVDEEKFDLDNTLSLLEKISPAYEALGFLSPVEAMRYLERSPVDVVILDTQMKGANGVDFAFRFKEICPLLNIVFTARDSRYSYEAIRMHASGYLIKPIDEEDLSLELNNLRNPVKADEPNSGKPFVQTFGNFTVFDKNGGMPVNFARSKSKECLAYLIDRRGAEVTIKELSEVLWEEAPYSKRIMNYAEKIISDLKKSLAAAGIEGIISKKYNSIRVDTTKIDCDYYMALDGNAAAISTFTGEYMNQYSWAERTLGGLSHTGFSIR
ncbi:MAG: response regulator [Clostridiales bacterium]|nr:response regulator [Clostridiales bacterium]